MATEGYVRRAWRNTAARTTFIRDISGAILTAAFTLVSRRSEVSSTITVDFAVASLAGGGAFVLLFGCEFVWRLVQTPYRTVVEENNRLLFRIAELENVLGTRVTNEQRRRAVKGLVNVYWMWKGLPLRSITPEYPLEKLRDDIRTLDFAMDALFTEPSISSDLRADFNRAIFVPGATRSFMDPKSPEHEVRYAARQKIRRLKRLIVKLERRIERTTE